MVEALYDNGNVITKTGEASITDAIKNVSVVMVYFSMHHCPPCQAFTPVLADLYNEYNADEKKFEVIFMSGDRTDEEYNKYYAEMPWLAVPRGDSRIGKLAKQFAVKGVPRLIVLKSDGKVISDDAV